MSSDTLYLRDPDRGIELRFSSVQMYTLTRNTKVTQHPVEEGVDISDHAQELPAILSVQITVTESPWAETERSGLSGPALLSRVLAVLQSMQKRRIQVVTHRLGVFPSMVITKIPTPIDQTRAMKISLELQEVRIATVTLVDVPAELVATSDPGSTSSTTEEISLAEQVAQDAQAAAAGLPTETDAGQQPTTDLGTTETTTDATVEEDTSAAYDMAEWLGVV